MYKNPYKFTGPLNPTEDPLVCMPRKSQVEKVISGILQGDYWAILGPRQMGKTTFLRLLREQLAVFHSIYLDLEISPQNDEAFFEYIIEEFLKEIPGSRVSDDFKRKNFGPEVNFYNFLRVFQPGDNQKIILFLDEIEKAPAASSLLRLWRKVFHERNDQPELRKYSVVIAGAADLIALTLGPTSPFNIAQKLYLNELPAKECSDLIEIPFNALNLQIETSVREKLIEQTAGHPQLLQFICSKLVELGYGTGKAISLDDTQEAFELLFQENDNLRSLDLEFKQNPKLGDLIRRLLNHEELDSIQYREFTISGIGPVTARGKNCVIRNPIYQTLFEKITQSDRARPESSKNSEYHTVFYTKEQPWPGRVGGEKDFLTGFFNFEEIEFTIHKNDVALPPVELELKEKAMLCYLAYKNFKALEHGFADWRKIPSTYEYRLSSTVAHNQKHIPEWAVLVSALGREPYGEDIRAWIFSLRRTLEKIDANDLIYSDAGRGRGYLLKGTVSFSSKG
jgi:hypothetical protein